MKHKACGVGEGAAPPRRARTRWARPSCPRHRLHLRLPSSHRCAHSQPAHPDPTSRPPHSTPGPCEGSRCPGEGKGVRVTTEAILGVQGGMYKVSGARQTGRQNVSEQGTLSALLSSDI